VLAGWWWSRENPAIFHAKQTYEGTVDACRADVGVLEDRKEAMEQELVHMKPLGSRLHGLHEQ
jgi:hypothetical protein